MILVKVCLGIALPGKLSFSLIFLGSRILSEWCHDRRELNSLNAVDEELDSLVPDFFARQSIVNHFIAVSFS